jgi:hypothetical protein
VVAASRGHLSGSGAGRVREWLRASGARADAAAAELALRVIGEIEGEDSGLRVLWNEAGEPLWHEAIDDLRRRLRTPEREVSPQGSTGLNSGRPRMLLSLRLGLRWPLPEVLVDTAPGPRRSCRTWGTICGM